MATTASRSIQIAMSGDQPVPPFNIAAADNLNSYGEIDNITLNPNNPNANVITPWSDVGFTITGVTIVPPAGNTTLISISTAAGVAVTPLHKTDPTSLGLDSSFVALYLTVAVQVVGVKFIWT